MLHQFSCKFSIIISSLGRIMHMALGALIVELDAFMQHVS